MKGVRLLRWSGSVLSPRTRPNSFRVSPTYHFRRNATAAAPIDPPNDTSESVESSELSEDVLTKLPSPPVQASKTSAKLAALHARLKLPSRFPIEILARTLVDPSADSSIKFNNRPFTVLGNQLLGNYASEYIICQYPRLPLAVVYAAMYAYIGPKALATMTKEWGVQAAAAPGGEVDPGFLQFKKLPPQPKPEQSKPEVVDTSRDPNTGYRRSMSSRAVYDDDFGELKDKIEKQFPDNGITQETASSNFVKAVVGALYLHAGRTATKDFFKDHFMSRQLNMAKLFQFRHPTKDLSRLCAREGFQAPVARVLSETGRASRHPVFDVGVFSGNEKLGEGAGSSLDEARTRAAVAALKGWYLYSPLDWRLPSDMEEPNAKPWIPLMVDGGDVV